MLSRYKHWLDEIFGETNDKIEEITNVRDLECLKWVQAFLVSKEKYSEANLIKQQIETLKEIENKNEEKKQAAMNEDFENAAKLKWVIAELESHLLTEH